MAYVTGEAILGTHPPHWNELYELGRAVAQNEGVTEAAAALQAVTNEHALYDASGVVQFFATITKIVDFTGHYLDDLTNICFTIGGILSVARRVRHFFYRPLSIIVSYIVDSFLSVSSFLLKGYERKQQCLEAS